MIEGEPLITVVVPAWDLGRELVDCVESVVSQDVSLRLLIVDNDSEAELPATPGERLRLPRQVSVGAARNAGLATVTTEYVFFMDGDDVLLLGALGYLLGKLDCDRRLVAAAGSILLWDPKTGRRAPSYYPPAWAHRLQKWPQAFALANVAVNAFPVEAKPIRDPAAGSQDERLPRIHGQDASYIEEHHPDVVSRDHRLSPASVVAGAAA